MQPSWMLLDSFVTMLLLITPSHAVTEVFIGAVFSPDPGTNRTIEKAFNLAIDQINSDAMNYPEIKLRGLIRYADPDDGFDNIEKVNSLLNSNISILIGPMETSAVLATHPLCSRARVPQIAPLTSLETIPVKNTGPSYLLRMSPTGNVKAKVIRDIVRHYTWQTMAVLGYQDKEASKGQSAFRLIANENEWNVVAASLFPPSPLARRDIFPMLVLRNLKESQSTRLATVFCPAWSVSKLMKNAEKQKMDLEKWTWIFSDFGDQESDLLGASGVIPRNMQGLLGIKPSVGKGARYEQFKQAWNVLMPNEEITVSEGRVYDSVLVVAEGIKRAINSGVDLSKPRSYVGFCGDLEKQPQNANGKELARHLNQVRIEGVMGKIQASDPDFFGSAHFDVVNLRADGQHKVGEWNEQVGLQMYAKPVWSSNSTKEPLDIPNILKGRTLNVTTILAPPFVMLKGDSKSSSNQTQEFEGLSIDILEEMRKQLGFNYRIYLAPDGKFGVRDRLTGEWNGVVKEIIEKKADLSIAPMTISSDRQTVLDFTHPYMTFGLAYMMRVEDVNGNYFRFLSPFDKSLWVAICVLVMAMSLLLWIFSLLSPWGYYGRCLQARSPKQLKPEVIRQADTLNLSNSIWSSWKGYVRRGGEHPNSWSGRMTVSVFWFAVVIINATYTANLTAHLTVSRMQTPIETILDLSLQTSIEYGTLKDSQLQTFFQKTDVPR